MDIHPRKIVTQIWKEKVRISTVGLFKAGERGTRTFRSNLGLHCWGRNKYGGFGS